MPTSAYAPDGWPRSATGSTERHAHVIDAGGCLVCPGFVDLHTHYDVQVFWDPTLSPSPLPRRHHRHRRQLRVLGGAARRRATATTSMHMLSRVEGMPLATLDRGTDWDWTSFGSYLERVDGAVVPNVGFLVGHSAVRRAVMGEAGSERAATDDEVAAMARLLGTSLDEGGLGFSSILGGHPQRRSRRPGAVPVRHRGRAGRALRRGRSPRGHHARVHPRRRPASPTRGVAHGPHVGGRRPAAQLERADRDGRSGGPGDRRSSAPAIAPPSPGAGCSGSPCLRRSRHG